MRGGGAVGAVGPEEAASRCSAETSGWSPERIDHRRRRRLERVAGREHRRAGALALGLLGEPRRRRASPSATPSPGLTTQTIRSAPASRPASMTHSSMGLPQTRCSTLGRSDRMRVPLAGGHDQDREGLGHRTVSVPRERRDRAAQAAHRTASLREESDLHVVDQNHASCH